MSKIKVTFDSNVWEKIVSCDENLIKIRESIISGKIEPYICEIAISLESIRKKERLPFFENYESKVETVRESQNENRFSSSICFSPNNDVHPGLHPVLKSRLLAAKSIGFKVLTMTNVGTVRSPEIPSEMKISFFDLESFWEYAEELARCSDFIQSLGAGAAEYFNIIRSYGLQGRPLSKVTQELPSNEEKKFYEAVAEWVDGDSLSAHYAYKNDYFCTFDSGKNAGYKSVFFPNNLKEISKRFNIKIISVPELSIL